MKKNNIVALFLLLFSYTVVSAQDSVTAEKTSALNAELFRLYHPWLQTSNPAGLALNFSNLPVRMETFTNGRNGDFKRVQEGGSFTLYGLESEAYSSIKNLNLYGRFRYENSLENDLNYSNTNDPYRGTPYDYVDMIGGDHYNREFFFLNGALSLPLSPSLYLGGAYDYKVGVAVQGNDPRPENVILDMTARLGLLYKAEKINLGMDLLYGYFNEEIDVDIVRENTYATMLSILGPCVFLYKQASSFNRLYKRQTAGADIQYAYSADHFKFLGGIKGLFYFETVQDGGTGGDASWNYLRDISVLEGLDWDIYANLMLTHGKIINLFDAKVSLGTQLGTEMLEHLDFVGLLDSKEWVLYLYDPKYNSAKISADLSWTYLKMVNEEQKDISLKLAAAYKSFSQDYYIPFQHEDYSGLIFSVEGTKTLQLNSWQLHLGTEVSMMKSLGGLIDFQMVNFLFYELIYPDFIYYTTNWYQPSLKIGLEKELNSTISKIYINTHLSKINAQSGKSMTSAGAGIGLIF